MKLSIAADHAGFALKAELCTFLGAQGHDITDHGTYSEDSTDYADFAHPLAKAVAEGGSELGILICGSANGVCMTANKHQKIRAAIAWLPELASLAKQHNNANVICLPARFIAEETAKEIVSTFLASSFEGGRHERRVGKIPCS